MSDLKKKHYDLILVYTSHRRHNNYLNIIKYMSASLRIGILKFETKHRWGESEEIYLQACLEAGAELVEDDATCHSVMISRFGKPKDGGGYYRDILVEMPERIKYQRVLINVDALMTGFLCLDDICEKLGPPVLMVPSKKLFGILEPETREYALTNNLEMVEVGTPFRKYPVFPDFETDYLLAYPSHVSVKNSAEHYQLLKNVVKTLKKIPDTEAVIVKPHNVRDTGNSLSYTMLSRRLGNKRWLFSLLLFYVHLFDISVKGRTWYFILPKKLMSLLVGLHNDYIFSRCENLLDDYPAYGFEHFVSGIKKGVITGISQTILESVLQRKAVCCCDDLPITDKPESYQILGKTFGIAGWHAFSHDGESCIEDSVREVDLMKYLKKTIEER